MTLYSPTFKSTAIREPRVHSKVPVFLMLGQSGTTAKGYNTYIEQRLEPFTSKEMAQLTGLLKGVSKSKLEVVCSDLFLRQLAPHMRDWRKLAPRFGIGGIEAEKPMSSLPNSK